MCLVKKGDPRACKVKAIESGADLTLPFNLEFSSHPGLGMVKGKDLHGIGNTMLIGETSSGNIMQFTVQNGGSDTDEQAEERKAFNKALSEAKTEEERNNLAEQIMDFG